MNFVFRWFVLGLFVLHTQEIQAQHRFNTAPTTLNDAIPFQLGSGFLILVEGRIGPLGPLKFILDTGATNTLIDRKIVDKLRLPRQKTKLVNSNQYVSVEWANLPELQLGPLAARNVHVMVGDLKQLSEFAEGVDVIIGVDVLRTTQSLRIDYGKSLVTFKTPGANGPVNLQAANAFTVQLPVQGRPVHLIIDTAVQGLFLYTDRLRKHLPQLKLSGGIKKAHAGRLRGRSALLSGIRVGADEVQASDFLIDGAPLSLPADIDGYLGINTLNAQIIEFNFAANLLQWQ